MRRLAYNMHVAMHGPDKPFEEKRVHTNFISRDYLKLVNAAKE
jgi:hypothetical protein